VRIYTPLQGSIHNDKSKGKSQNAKANFPEQLPGICKLCRSFAICVLRFAI
jgi:hypothetical protein